MRSVKVRCWGGGVVANVGGQARWSRAEAESLLASREEFATVTLPIVRVIVLLFAGRSARVFEGGGAGDCPHACCREHQRRRTFTLGRAPS